MVEMKYLGSSFTVALGGDAYGDGWERIFGAKAQYERKMRELLEARAMAGGTLSENEESKRVGELENAWQKMTEEEQEAIEREKFWVTYRPHSHETPEKL